VWDFARARRWPLVALGLAAAGVLLFALVPGLAVALAGATGWAVRQARAVGAAATGVAGLGWFLWTIAPAVRVAALFAQSLRERRAAAAEAEAKARVELRTLQEKLDLARGEAARSRGLAAKYAAVDGTNAASPALMLEYLMSDSEDVGALRQQLGIIAKVRRCFEQLDAVVAEMRQLRTPEALDRIILYIDDLDRCDADQVAQVLQAVHLLLAFECFVVVVAVDARWLKESLERSHGQLRHGDALDGGPVDPLARPNQADDSPATAADYLEKIFQIPLWLRPVPASQRAPLIAALLEPHPKVEAPRRGGDRAAAIEAGGLQTAGGTSTRAASASKHAPVPGVIHVDPAEFRFLERVAPLLDGNPRALKRFANTYRLVKASLSDVELDYFVKDAPYRVCMAQLAVLATQRQRARELVRLTDATAGRPQKLESWLRELESQKDPLVQSLGADLRAVLLPRLKDLPLETFAVWLERTRRYSFYL